MIDPHSYNSARFADLRRVLTGWLNDELAQFRIIVKSLEEDLPRNPSLGLSIRTLALPGGGGAIIRPWPFG